MTDERPGNQATREQARDEELRRWEERRSAGRSSFIWRYGVLGWGLPAALMTIAYGVVKENGLAWHAVEQPFSFKLRAGIALAVVMFPAIGHLLGRRLWEAGEERYRSQGGGAGPVE